MWTRVIELLLKTFFNTWFRQACDDQVPSGWYSAEPSSRTEYRFSPIKWVWVHCGQMIVIMSWRFLWRNWVSNYFLNHTKLETVAYGEWSVIFDTRCNAYYHLYDILCSYVNKDLTPKDQNKDKDLTPKDQDLAPRTRTRTWPPRTRTWLPRTRTRTTARQIILIAHFNLSMVNVLKFHSLDIIFINVSYPYVLYSYFFLINTYVNLFKIEMHNKLLFHWRVTYLSTHVIIWL